jgi:hypothetical protein
MPSWRAGLKLTKIEPIRIGEKIMSERRIKIPYPLPNSPVKDGTEVNVRESTERWTEVTLEDGTVLRIKLTVVSAVRIDGEYDPEGNPAYSLRMNPVVATASAPDKLKRPPTIKAPGIN